MKNKTSEQPYNPEYGYNAGIENSITTPYWDLRTAYIYNIKKLYEKRDILQRRVNLYWTSIK